METLTPKDIKRILIIQTNPPLTHHEMSHDELEVALTAPHHQPPTTFFSFYDDRERFSILSVYEKEEDLQEFIIHSDLFVRTRQMKIFVDPHPNEILAACRRAKSRVYQFESHDVVQEEEIDGAGFGQVLWVGYRFLRYHLRRTVGRYADEKEERTELEQDQSRMAFFLERQTKKVSQKSEELDMIQRDQQNKAEEIEKRSSDMETEKETVRKEREELRKEREMLAQRNRDLGEKELVMEEKELELEERELALEVKELALEEREQELEKRRSLLKNESKQVRTWKSRVYHGLVRVIYPGREEQGHGTVSGEDQQDEEDEEGHGRHKRPRV